MNAPLELSELIARAARLSYVVHGEMKAVEAVDRQAGPIDELGARIWDSGPLAPLRAQRCWVIWRYEGRNGGKPSKVPHVAANPRRKASSKTPADWCNFETAIAAAQHTLLTSGATPKQLA